MGVNPAFEALTGYSREEAVGRNCRFLQGEGTEQDAVLQLVEAIRAAEPTQIEMTNYRKDNSPFRNLLCLQPVHDSLGEYWYSIGILVDVLSLSTAQSARLAALRRLLPRRFEGGFSGGDEMDEEAVTNEPREPTIDSLPLSDLALPAKPTKRESMPQRDTAFPKLLWLEDPIKSVRTIVASEPAASAFRAHLGRSPARSMCGPRRSRALSQQPSRAPRSRREKTVRRHAPACRLETLVALHAVENLPAEEVAAATLELAAKTFSSNLELLTALERRVLPQRLQEHAAACLLSLANEQLAGFIQSASSNASVNSLQLGIERPFGSSSHLLWGRYKAPSKFVGWLYALVRVADQIPVSISVSDMQVAACIGWSYWTHGVSCRGSSAQPISITALLLRDGWIVMCRWLGCPWCMSTRSSARLPVTLNWRHRGRTAASYRWSGGVVGRWWVVLDGGA